MTCNAVQYCWHRHTRGPGLVGGKNLAEVMHVYVCVWRVGVSVCVWTAADARLCVYVCAT